MRARPTTILLWLAAALAATTQIAAQAAAQAPTDPAAPEPAYVVRGRQTEARQRAYHARIDRFYQALTEALQNSAPDLLPKFEAPPARAYGYQLLPRLVPDPPPSPPATPYVVSFSWGWSDTLIAREIVKLDRLDADLAQLPPLGSGGARAAYETLVTGYRTIIDARRQIDGDVDYNWIWQAGIARDRPLFDRLQARQDLVLKGGAVEAAAANNWAAPRDFLRIEHPTPHEWLLTVPFYTDMTDAAFVESFRSAMESLWHVRVERNGGTDEFRVRLEMRTLSPEQLYCGRVNNAAAPAADCAPPAAGAHIDLDAHVARFPKGSAVLTTGATVVRLIGDGAIVLPPHDMTPHVLAHEFGHVLGFPDAYYRGYRDGGGDGFVITELADLGDIMGAPGSGPVLARHFDTLISTNRAK